MSDPVFLARLLAASLMAVVLALCGVSTSGPESAPHSPHSLSAAR